MLIDKHSVKNGYEFFITEFKKVIIATCEQVKNEEYPEYQFEHINIALDYFNTAINSINADIQIIDNEIKELNNKKAELLKSKMNTLNIKLPLEELISASGRIYK